MNDKKTKEIARNIVRFIVADLMDRGGLEEAWDSIDGDIQNEILKEWNKIAIRELKK
jgi:hypothetical protein